MLPTAYGVEATAILGELDEADLEASEMALPALDKPGRSAAAAGR